MIRAALALALIASAAEARVVIPCGDRSVIVEALEVEHGETRRFWAMSGQRVVETFASDAGTWTILLTDPTGKACIVGVGDAFEAVEPQTRGAPS